MMDFVNYIYYLRVYPRLTHISAHLLCSLCIIYGIGVDMALEYNSLSPRAKQCVLCQPMSHSWFSAYYTVQYTVYGLPFCVLAPKSEQKKCTAYIALAEINIMYWPTCISYNIIIVEA